MVVPSLQEPSSPVHKTSQSHMKNAPENGIAVIKQSQQPPHVQRTPSVTSESRECSAEVGLPRTVFRLKRISTALDMPLIQTALANVLNELVSQNENFPCKPTRFHSNCRPNVSVDTYLDRIVRYANCSPECYMLALIYLDRIAHRHPNKLRIDILTVHRLLITSVMTAAKFFDDFYYNNDFYSRVGGISCSEMNQLEVEFLYMVGFQLYVSESEFSVYEHHLLTRATELKPECISQVEQAVREPSLSSVQTKGSLNPSTASLESIDEMSMDDTSSAGSQPGDAMYRAGHTRPPLTSGPRV